MRQGNAVWIWTKPAEKLRRRGWYLLPVLLVYGTLVLYAGGLYVSGGFLRWTLGEQEILSFVQDDTCYVFLPSYADPAEVVPQLHPLFRAWAAGVSLRDEQSAGAFPPDTSCTLRVWSLFPVPARTLCVMRSEGVSALFVTARTGALKQIRADRNKEASVQADLYDAAGVLNYSGQQDTLKSRGQSSWGLPKKSWSLTLNQPAGLLGMPAGQRWALIANYLDPTNLRNKLAYDLGQETGLVPSPRCEYADLYLNGEYAGLYLLTQKPESVTDDLQITGNMEWGGVINRILV